MNLFEVYPLFEITPERGLGCRLFDNQGHQYLDLYGGHAVVSVGHSHPHYIKRITDQLNLLGFYSNAVINPRQLELADKLGIASGYDNYELFLVNSGAEANENALKLASFTNKKSQVVAFQGGFHGRTAGALAVTDNEKLRAPINSSEHVTILPLNDLDRVETAFKENEISAVIIEGVQGIAGINVPDPNFLQHLRRLCDKHGALLILDEIQSGYGRTGKFFAHQYANIKPDIITMAKGMGNGFPIGGVLIKPELQAIYGQLGTTFGGNHLACCAALAVLEIMESENLVAQANKVGNYLHDKLSEISAIKEIRGQGLMIGLDLGTSVKRLRNHLLFEERIFVGSSSDPHILRLLPPLCLTTLEADQFIESLNRSLENEQLFID